MQEVSIDRKVDEVLAAIGVQVARELDFADEVVIVESAPYRDNYGGSQLFTMDGIMWTMRDGRRIRFAESVDEYPFILIKTPEAWDRAVSEIGKDADPGDLMVFESDGEGVFYDGLESSPEYSFYDLLRLRGAYLPDPIRALILSAVNGEITSGI
jgi:hypothetical protein